MTEVEKPFCAVWMVTFNHAPFIAEAIEGVLSQKTRFSVRLFIGDDCSTDGTRAICVEYARNYPNIIQFIPNEINDIFRNARNVYHACFNSGAKYVALCEGDDYWTDENKLQIQVDFLEANPGFAMVFHNTLDVSQNESRPMYLNMVNDELSIQDFVKHTYSRTVSMVFRKPEEWYSENFPRTRLGDSLLCILLLQYGKAKYLDRVMATYRIHAEGLWSSRTATQKGRLRFELFLKALEQVKPQFRVLIIKELNELSIAYVISSLRKTDLKQALVGLRYFIDSPYKFKVNKLRRVFSNRLKAI